MARRLYLSGKYRKRYVIVDDEDYEYLRTMKWFALTGFQTHKGKKYCYPWRGYVKTNIPQFGKQKKVFLHHMVAERKYGYLCPKGFQIDHINSNPKDNRRCNLRYIPREENTRRSMMNSKGYGMTTDGKWAVYSTRTDPFTKKVNKVFFRTCQTENEARLVAYLYKKGYKVPEGPLRRKRKRN